MHMYVGWIRSSNLTDWEHTVTSSRTCHDVYPFSSHRYMLFPDHLLGKGPHVPFSSMDTNMPCIQSKRLQEITYKADTRCYKQPTTYRQMTCNRLTSGMSTAEYLPNGAHIQSHPITQYSLCRVMASAPSIVMHRGSAPIETSSTDST